MCREACPAILWTDGRLLADDRILQRRIGGIMEKPDWEAITAIGTAAAAVFTAIMAWFTRKAIRDGQGQRQEANDHFSKTREQDKRHHEDTFRPLVVLTPSNPSDAIDRQDILSSIPHSALGYVLIQCAVNNIGVGPALNIRLHVRCDRRMGFGPSRELVPLAADGSFNDGRGRIEIPVIYKADFNSADLKNLPSGLWLLVLEYEDVFGNTFHTLHSKHFGEPWTYVGRGKAPDTTPQLPDIAQIAAAALLSDPTNPPGHPM